jgi:enoyl-CoA hydratase/carnithine racemase
MKDPTLTLEIDADRIAVITLTRPEVLNAINSRMYAELRDCFLQFHTDPAAAACLIVTGAGTRGFCAGADMKERRGISEEQWRQQHLLVQQMIRAIMNCPVPSIAAVNGVAFGGGCEIALACDFIYASEHARFALPEVSLGIMPGAAGTQNLPRAVGVRRAKEVILTGAPFSAAEALDWGMVNRICPADRLLSDAKATAVRIAANAPVSVRQAKKAIEKGTELGRSDGYDFEIQAYLATLSTRDRREGIEAFNEKRKPCYAGK